MRILALTNLYPNPRDPHRAAFNRRQFAALAQEHEVQVIAPIAWTRRWTAPPGAAGNVDPVRVCDGMIIHHPEYLFTPKVLRGWYGHFFAGSIRACFHRIVRDFRAEVVLGSWAYPDGWAALQLAREAGLPVAIKVHGSDLLTIRDRGRDAARHGKTVEALQGANAVIAVGSHLRDRAIEMGATPNRVHIVRNGIDTETFHPGARGPARQRLQLTSSEPLILFVGNLVPVKGLDVLMGALARLAESAIPFQCVLAGEGSLKGTLQSRIDALGLSSRVRLIGGRPQEELADWYRAADLIVLPSRSEGIPNVLLEAAACGSPIVASAVGGVPEICPPAGLVPPVDVGALADGIRRYLDPLTRPTTVPLLTPGSWRDSARALADVLQNIVVDSSSQVSQLDQAA